jgi:hypothetical protein
VNGWYFNRELKPQGPFSLAEMKKKISRGDVGPDEWVCSDEDANWRPAREWSEFPEGLFPALQSNLFRTVDPTQREWTLLVKRPEEAVPAQKGPYSLEEIRGLLATGMASEEDYIWRTGLSGWIRIKDRPEYFQNCPL